MSTTPIIVALLLGITAVTHVVLSAPNYRRDIYKRYMSCFFILTYLVLPSVSTSAFGAFTCTNIDPSGVVPNTPMYLYRDYSIACDSKRYRIGTSWAIATILIYPVGITAFYLIVLLINSDAIVNKEAPELQEGCVQQDCVQPCCTPNMGLGNCCDLRAEIEFLHRSYKRKYFYWEVIETLRRLLLTAVMSVTSTGSAGQVVFGIAVSVVFMKLYAYFEPFNENKDNILQEIAQYQVRFHFMHR